VSPVPGERAYRLLLRLHPAAFRRRYGSELMDCFRDAWRAEAAGAGAGAALRFWVKTIVGTVGTAGVRMPSVRR
jgi:hypothetical protein